MRNNIPKRKIPRVKVVDNLPSDMTFNYFITHTTHKQKVKFYEEEHQYYLNELVKEFEGELLRTSHISLAEKVEMWRTLCHLQGSPIREKIEKAYWYFEVEKIIDENHHEFSILLYVIKRVFPSMCDSRPLEFIYNAIREYDINQILTFMQIAAFRWSLVEKSCITQTLSRMGRMNNVSGNSKESQIIQEIFRKQYSSCKDDEKEDCVLIKKFPSIYPEILTALLQNNLIRGILNELRKRYTGKQTNTSKQQIKETKDQLDQILNELSACKNESQFIDTGIFEALKKLSPLYKRYYDKYRHWVKNLGKNTHILYFESVERSFYKDELKNTIWKELGPWPLEMVLREYHEPLDIIHEIIIPESCKFQSKLEHM